MCESNVAAHTQQPTFSQLARSSKKLVMLAVVLLMIPVRLLKNTRPLLENYRPRSRAGSAEPCKVRALSIFPSSPPPEGGQWGLKCQTAPLSCRGLQKETAAAASCGHSPLKSESRGLGFRCRLGELLLPEMRKLIYIRMGWRLRPLRVLWIWGIKHNGFHVGLSFTTPRLQRGTVCSLESRSDLFCS